MPHATTDIDLIKQYNDISVYRSDINNAVSEYIDNLMTEDDLQKTEVFNGLINWIYYRVFKPDKRTKQFKVNSHFSLQNSIINYTDTATIAELWEIYKQLCARYGKTFTLTQFCSMTGITSVTLGEWLKGGKGSTSDKRELIEKARQDTEASLWSKTVNDNSIGSIFGLKAIYGYSDSSTLTVRTEHVETVENAESIAERHSLADKPDLPQLDN